MAERGERRMLFDIRGRRRHVVRVVYAVLALLMGLSLFLVVGPFNLGEVLNTGGASSADEVLIEQAERIESRLKADPKDESMLLSLTRARVNAGNAQMDTNPQTGQPEVTPEALVQFERGVEAWGRYLEAAKKPNPAAAQLVAATYFNLALGSTTLREGVEEVEEAAEAQRLAAKARPSVGAYSSLAYYEYISGDFAGGDKAARQAKQLATSKREEKAIDRQLNPTRQQGRTIQASLKKETAERGKQGKEAFESVLGGAAGGTGASLP